MYYTEHTDFHNNIKCWAVDNARGNVDYSMYGNKVKATIFAHKHKKTKSVAIITHPPQHTPRTYSLSTAAQVALIQIRQLQPHHNKPSRDGWNFWKYGTTSRKQPIKNLYRYTFQHPNKPTYSTKLNTNGYTKMEIDPHRPIPKRNKYKIADTLSFQLVRLLAVLLLHNERSYIDIIKRVLTCDIPTRHSDQATLGILGRRYGLIDILRACICLSRVPIRITLCDQGGEVLTKFVNRSARSQHQRFVICLGTPLFLYRHSGNSYVDYELMATRSKVAARYTVDVSANTDIRQHLDIEQRISSMEDERRIYLAHLSTVAHPKYEPSGYYLGSERRNIKYSQPTSGRTGPTVQTSPISIRADQLGRPSGSTMAVGERHDVVPFRHDGGNNKTLGQPTHIHPNGPNGTRILPHIHTRVELDVVSQPDGGPIIRMYGVKWNEDELTLSSLLHTIVEKFDVDCRFTRVQFVEGERRVRTGRRRASKRVCNRPRCVGVWSKSGSLHKFCRTQRGGTLRNVPSYNRPIVWKTFPRNSKYAEPGRTGVSTRPKRLRGCMQVQAVPNAFVDRINAIQIGREYISRSGIAAGRSKIRVRTPLGCRFVSLNTQGLVGKLNDLGSMLHHMSADIVALQETWKHRDWLIKVAGYRWIGGCGKCTGGFRMMRGMGFLIAERYIRSVGKCQDGRLKVNSDILWCKVKLYKNKKRCVFFGNVYLDTHNKSDAQILRLYGILTEMVGYIRSEYPGCGIIIAGDFNSHSKDLFLQFGSNVEIDAGGRYLDHWHRELGITCHNALSPTLNTTRVNRIHGLTTSESIIDYFFSSGCAGEEAFAIDATGISDHNMVICDFHLNLQEFTPKPHIPTARIDLSVLTQNSRAGQALREELWSEVELSELDVRMVEILSTVDGRTHTELATAAARKFDKDLLRCGKKVCGVRKFHPRYTRPGFTKECNILRDRINTLGHANRRQTNILRRKIRRILDNGKSKSLRKQISKCESLMRRNDPMAIWNLIDRICMLGGGTKIPYYNDNGVHRFTSEEISAGFTRDCKQLFTIPPHIVTATKQNRLLCTRLSYLNVRTSGVWLSKAGWGKQRPMWKGEKYVGRFVSHTMDFNTRRIAGLRHNIKNGKAVGWFDKLPGELVKYGAKPGVSSVDRALSTLWSYVYEHSACPTYWQRNTLTMLYKGEDCPGTFTHYRSIATGSINGKYYEKYMSDEMATYLCNPFSPFLNPHQGGFWRARGCEQLQFSVLGAISLILRGYKTSQPPRVSTRLRWIPNSLWNTVDGQRHLRELEPPTPDLSFECNGRLPTDVNKHAFMFFLDMRKAFDTTSRDILYHEMRRFGISLDTVLALSDIYNKIRLQVNTNGTLGQPFTPQRGFPQGHPGSPGGWNISYDGGCLDALCRAGLCYRITGNGYAIFVFADDTLLVCNHPGQLQGIIRLTRWAINRVEMAANVKKSAVMICGKKYKTLKKMLKFYWGDKEIPIVSTYKYLGVHLSEKFPSKVWANVHMGKALIKSNIAYHKCAPFLTDALVPIAWRMQHFRAMVGPMYGYASVIWLAAGDAMQKLMSSYNSKLRYTLGLDSRPSSTMVCTITGVQPPEYWWELNNVVFKYVTMRKNVPGLHKEIFALSHVDDMSFTKWSDTERHGDRLLVGSKEIPSKKVIKDSMMIWKRQLFWNSNNVKQSTLDPMVLSDFVMNERHFLHMDAYGYEIPSWRKPNYTKWLRNNDILFLIKCLGGGNNLLNRDCICLQCGIARRSWRHITMTCSQRGGTYPSLSRFSKGKLECIQEIAKLRTMVDRMTPNLFRELRGEYVSILTKDAIECYYVSRLWTNGSYRVMNILTQLVSTIDLSTLLRNGKLAVLRNLQDVRLSTL